VTDDLILDSHTVLSEFVPRVVSEWINVLQFLGRRLVQTGQQFTRVHLFSGLGVSGSDSVTRHVLLLARTRVRQLPLRRRNRPLQARGVIFIGTTF
jgi:hypothetical protein